MPKDPPVLLLNPLGPGHRNGDAAKTSHCGQCLDGAIETTTVACKVHRIPLCFVCFPKGQPTP